MPDFCPALLFQVRLYRLIAPRLSRAYTWVLVGPWYFTRSLGIKIHFLKAGESLGFQVLFKCGRNWQHLDLSAPGKSRESVGQTQCSLLSDPQPTPTNLPAPQDYLSLTLWVWNHQPVKSMSTRGWKIQYWCKKVKLIFLPCCVSPSIPVSEHVLTKIPHCFDSQMEGTVKNSLHTQDPRMSSA
jgi:hypothetical protein